MSGTDAKLTSLWLTVNGRAMHARVAADPPQTDRLPVVLVHGLGVSSRYLIPLAEDLGNRYRVYAPDLPGFGKTEKPDHILKVDELADALAAWLDTAGIQRAAFIGNSMGCQTIVSLAVRYPHYVDRAVLIGPTIDPSARSLPVLLWRGLGDMVREPLHYYPTLIRDYLQAGLRRTLQTLRYAMADPVETRLPLVQAPVLVVRGGHDSIVSEAWAAQVAELLPQGHLLMFPQQAHVVHYSAPELMRAAIAPFLDDAAPATDTASEALTANR